MWSQVQERVFAENGGVDQVERELEPYNPLIPKGQKLVAIFIIEIDDPDRRKGILGGLRGIEETAFLAVGGARILGAPETDQDRTRAGDFDCSKVWRWWRTAPLHWSPHSL
jgi:hypothetical protein